MCLRLALAIVALCLMTSTSRAQDAVQLLVGDEPNFGWMSDNGQEFPGAVVDLRVDDEAKHNGKPSLRLTGDFTKGGNYVEASRAFDANVRTLSMWVKYAGGEKMTVRLIDGGGQCHQIVVKIADTPDWQRVVLPVADFFAKRGQPDAVPNVVKYEYWGGAKDGKWHGEGKSLHVLIGKTEELTTRTMWLSDVQVTTADGPARTSYREDFEKYEPGAADGWTVSGSVAVAAAEPFKGQRSLVLRKSEERLNENVRATGPSFPVTPGPVEVKLATRTDLTSMDNSYSVVVSLESLGAGGASVGRTIVLEQFRKNVWRPVSKRVEVPAGATAARFVVQINKETPGRVWVDELSVAPLLLAKKDDRVQRLMFTTAALGNLLKPDDSRQVKITVWSNKPLDEAQRTAHVTVKDYWGAEQSAPLPVTLARTEQKAEGNVVYEGTLDLSPVDLSVGRYYELHGEIVREGGEPFKNYSSLAILPEAPANSFKPEEIPFTSRNWDNRITEYIYLTNRIGVRIVGIWGKWGAEPPYKNEAPRLDLVEKLGMGWLTGSPAHAIEQRSKGWEKYDEKALREGVRKFIADYGHVRPMVVNLGNEPHNKGDAVLPEVNAYRILYDEIKRIDPAIKVVGTSSGPIEDYFKAGYGQWCDAYDFHVYEDAIGVRRILEETYPKLFAKYGHAKPIWSTELGLNSQGLARLTVASEVTKKFANFFAGGGENVSWFGLLYPDLKGAQHDSFGSAHNVFDCRYNKYAPKLDAVAYYNAVNAILDKKYVADKVYGENAHGFLFRNAKGDALQVWYKDKGRQDAFIPMNGVADVQVIRVDGTRRSLDAAGRGVMLTINEDPVLLLYSGADVALPAELGKPAVALNNPVASVVRSEGAVVDVALGEGASADAVSLVAQPFWKVEKQQGEAGTVRFALAAPAETTVRDADMIVVLAGPNGKPNGELYYRPAVTGTMTLSVLPVPVTEGKEPAVKVVVRNNSPTPQDVAWDVAISGEQSLKAGNFTEVAATETYFADSPSGTLTVAGKQSAEVVLPLVGADRFKVYRVRATARDASGRTIVDERPIAGFVAVSKAKATPSLDGSLDEEIWQRAAVQRVDKADAFFAFKAKTGNTQDWTGPADLSADIRYAWDDEHLYVGVAVTDDVAGPVKPTYAVWQQDGLQFLIDPQRTSNQKVGKYDYGIGDRGDGTTRAECYLSADSNVQMGAVKDIQIATKRAGAGNITYEVAIPWRCVAPFKPAIGANLGFTMIFNEDDGAGRDAFMTWFGNAHNKDVDKVGDLILTE